MKAKRLISGILASIMVLTALTACSKKQDNDKGVDKASSATDIVAEAGKYPLVKNPITLKVFTSQIPQVQNYETNEFTKHMEKKTNVKVEWTLTPKADVNNKVNLLLASNSDLPDVFLSVINLGQLGMHGPQGTFVSLNKYIDKYGTGFKRIEEMQPDIKKHITFPDGNIYALPIVNMSENVKYNKRLWVYKPWLDKLNLKVPTTTEEFYNVLKAFKEKDPNGNGIADEIPMVAYKENSSETGMNFEQVIMNSFVYDEPLVRRMYLSNGKVDSAYTQQGWKEGTAYFRKLFQEGLIDPVSFTQDEQSMKKLGDNKGAVIVGSSVGPNTTKITSNQERMYQYINVAPLKGPDGTQQNYYKPTTIAYGQFVITKNCKYPDVAYRWADTMYNEEESLLARLGVKGKDWTDASETDKAPGGQKALYKSITTWGVEQNSNWYLNGMPWFGPWEGKDGAGSKMDDFLYKITQEQKKYAPKEVLPQLLMTEAEAQQIASITAITGPYIEQAFAKFCIEKNLDFEKEWKNYLSELKKMNNDEIVKITQTAYDRQFKNKK